MHVSMAVLTIGLAGGAQAQSTWWMHDVPDGATLLPGESITIRFSMGFEGGGAPFEAFGVTYFNTLNQAGAELGGIEGWEVLNNLDHLTGDLTTTDGDSLYGSTGGQLTSFGYFTLDNPIDVFEFTWKADEDATPGEVSFLTDTYEMVLWIGEDKESAAAVTDVPVTEMSFGWTVVPAPAGALLLGLGFVLLGRRRRGGRA